MLSEDHLGGHPGGGEGVSHGWASSWMRSVGGGARRGQGEPHDGRKMKIPTDGHPVGSGWWEEMRGEARGGCVMRGKRVYVPVAAPRWLNIVYLTNLLQICSSFLLYTLTYFMHNQVWCWPALKRELTHQNEVGLWVVWLRPRKQNTIK